VIAFVLCGSLSFADDSHVSALELDAADVPITANRIGQVTQSKKIVYQSDFQNIEELRFSNNQQWLAVAGGEVAESGVVEIVDWKSKKLRHRIELHADVIWKVAWSSDDSLLVTASQDGTCCVVDTRSGDELRTFIGHSKAVTAVTFVDEKTVVSAGLDNTLRVWNPNTGKIIRSLTNHTNSIRDLAFRPQREGLPMVLSAGRDRTVRLWQPTIGRMVRFARLKSAPLAVIWSPDGTRVFASCEDGSVWQVDPDTMAAVILDKGDARRKWCIAVAKKRPLIVVAGERGALKQIQIERSQVE
jgi:WD40 repeat protein